MDESGHFLDFSPDLWAGAPPTYLDSYRDDLEGRWFISDAGILWTDDDTLLGLDTTSATDWELVSRIRAGLAEQYAQNRPATEVFSRLQAEIDPPEWSSGPLAAAGIAQE